VGSVIVYCIAVTFLAAFLAGFFAAGLKPLKKKGERKVTAVKTDAERTLENFLNYNGEIQ
jgi:hypothetical protein